MHLNRICPICGSNEKNNIFKQSFAEIPGVSFLKGYQIVQCARCGFYYADNIPKQGEFDDYYKNQSKYESVLDTLTDSHRIRFERSLTFMKHCIETYGMDFNEMRIADIGCATGNFLRFLQEKGLVYLMGIDPSLACVHFLEECGLKAKQAVVNELNGEETFDFIRLNAVLEHVVDLHEFIEHIKTVLAPGGAVYLSVPNIEGFFEEENCPFQEFSVEHINYFSAQSLKMLMQKHSFCMIGHNITTTAAFSELEAIFILKQQQQMPCCTCMEKDTSADAKILEYLYKSQLLEDRINERLNQLVQSQEPVIVWGVGTHTLRQLAVGNLAKCNIRMFVDSNPHYQNTTYRGIPICSPKEIDSDEQILVSSWHAQDAIIHYGREQLGLKNVFLTLYDSAKEIN